MQIDLSIILLAILFMVLLVLAGCARLATGDATSTVHEQQKYSPPDWPQTLFADVYVPRGAGPFPAVLVVHGGGWERRSRQDMDGVAERLAGAGYAVVNIDYRFAPEYRFPAQLHDLQQAMHWIRRHAADYAIDRERIAALGYSSGAHLVSLLAVIAERDNALDRPHGGSGTRPVAVVAGGTPGDLTAFDDGRLLRQFLGGTKSERPDAYRDASPVTHTHADAPPFFLFHGTRDRLVPISQAEALREALTTAGTEATLHRQPLRGHVGSFLWRGGAMHDAEAFLDRHIGDTATDDARISGHRGNTPD